MSTDPLTTRLKGISSTVTLVGTDDEVKTQLALLLGICQTREIQDKGLDINFQKFIDIFEDGFFKGFAPKENKTLSQYWGKTLKSRPRIRILKETSLTDLDSWTNQGYYLAEFQPDRTNEEESYLLFGTPAQLIQEIMYWMNMHRKMANLNTGVGGGTYQRLPSSVTGQCFITLRFTGQAPKKQTHWVEKSFRWVKVDPQTVKEETIKSLANTIKLKFNDFTFTTGINSFTYNRPDQGFNRVWGYFNSQNDAMRLFDRLLELQDFKADWSRLTQSSVVQPGTRFQKSAKKTRQANVLIQPQEERPVITMYFQDALLKFPRIPRPVALVDKHGNIINVKKVLADYQD